MPRTATPQKIEGASGAPLRPRAEGDPLVARFLADAATERDGSRNTLLGYARDLGQFAEFTWGSASAPPYPWTKVVRDDARAFLVGLSRSDAAPTTVRRKLSALRSFYAFLVREGEIPDSPLAMLRGPKKRRELPDVLSEDAEVLGAHLSSPVAMQTQALYPVREYGSAMAPFYTVLAQWVGSLLAAVLLRVRVKDGADLRSAEAFWGRYGLYALVGLMQGLIVSLGDLFYVHIQCLYPWRFVLAACVNGLVFSMIHFALVYALESVGQALAVILLVTQVAGAGGTYPVEVLPAVFQKLYPFMPFRYAMDAMRECVAGAYGNAYWRCIGLLLLFALAAAVLGLVLYRPARGLNRLIQQGKERSEIML